MQSAHNDDQFWRNIVRNGADTLPFNGDVRHLAEQWLGGHLSSDQAFEAIEKLTEGQVPGDDGSLTGITCYQRTLERVKDLLGLQHTVLFCLEHDIEGAEERRSEGTYR